MNNLINKSQKRQSGFTIVELLIVIVVIGILAAITIVAFNGIQNRGKTASGQSLANSTVKKLEAYNSINSAYPTTKTQIQGTSESKIDGLPAATTAGTTPVVVPNTDTIFSGALDSSSGNSGKSVRIAGTAAGGNVYYWDYSASTPAEVAVKYGP
ncbi:MAG: type II secretion system protein [Pedobacter sp.]|nr:MAG: type II secretion system protein [Pedobacter sp.]